MDEIIEMSELSDVVINHAVPHIKNALIVGGSVGAVEFFACKVPKVRNLVEGAARPVGRLNGVIRREYLIGTGLLALGFYNYMPVADDVGRGVASIATAGATVAVLDGTRRIARRAVPYIGSKAADGLARLFRDDSRTAVPYSADG